MDSPEADVEIGEWGCQEIVQLSNKEQRMTLEITFYCACD